MRNANLTGSSTVRPMTHSVSVSCALAQLRSSVTLCCWVVILALGVQTAIWCASAFTGLRWDSGFGPATGPAESSVPLVVVGPGAADEVRSAFDPVPPPPEIVAAAAVEGPRNKSPLDSIFGTAAGISTGIGAIGTLALLPLMGLGVLLAAASATDGVEKSVSGFSWTMFVVVIVLAFSGVLAMPWGEGGVWSYTAITAQVDAAAGSTGSVSPGSRAGMNILARYIALPLACLVGLLIALARFRTGIHAGLVPAEDFALDASLESEAANIKPSSLHGGRAAVAMQSAMGHEQNGDATSHARTSPPAGATIRAVPQGDAPPRII